jgi:hypothetical protein
MGIIYDDQIGFWDTTFTFGPPNNFWGTPFLADNNVIVKSGVRSTSIDTQTGGVGWTYSWEGLWGAISPPIALNRFLSFWLFTSNCGGTLVIILSDDAANSVSKNITENWAGWKQVSIDKSEFSAGIFDWDSVTGITLVFDTSTPLRYLDLVEYDWGPMGHFIHHERRGYT